MALGHTARGTVNLSTGIDGTITKTSVPIASGSVIVVGLGHNQDDAYASSILWNGHALTARKQANRAALVYCELWTLDNCPGETGDVVATFGDGLLPPVTAAMFVAEVTGAALAAAFDQSAGNNGSSTSPSSGASGTLAQAAEIGIGCIVTGGPLSDTAGSWSNSFSNSQRDGTSLGSSDTTIAHGFKIVSATTALTFAKTGITNRAWVAIGITLKELVAAAGARPDRALLGVG